MKMKVTLGVFGLVVLGSAAVLANSSQPLFELIKLAANYQLAAVVPAATEIRSDRSDTAKVENPEQRFPITSSTTFTFASARRLADSPNHSTPPMQRRQA